MTILPKKKQQKQQQKDGEEERDNYHQTNSQQGQGSGGNVVGVGGNQIVSSVASSRQWSTRNEDKRSAPENGHASIGPTLSKRRLRTNRNVERDSKDLHQRSLMTTVHLSMNKSSLNTPSNSPRGSQGNENDLTAIPSCSRSIEHEHNEQNLSKRQILVPVSFSNPNDPDNDEEDEEDGENIEDFSGYNSGDEYQKQGENTTSNDWEEKERSFERVMRKKGFVIKKMSEDGACLFRAVADQVYGDQEMHSAVRKLCMDYMEKNGDYFSHYVTENFQDYIQRKRDDHIHGNHIEIQALSEIYNRPIQVYHYTAEPINVENCQKTDNEPIRLSYHRNSHYNSIVNPFKATIGVGLGLPAFKPGLAEKSLMEKALRISEQHELEQAMLEDKIRATDWEATNDAIEEQIARESYMEWLRENERRTKTKSTPTSTLTNIDDDNLDMAQSPPPPTKTNTATLSPRCYSPRSSRSSPNILHERSSPKRCNNSLNVEMLDKEKSTKTAIIDDPTATFLHEVPASVLGLNDLEETDPIIAQVLAQSQAEYLETLKASSTSSSTSASRTQVSNRNTGNSSKENGENSSKTATSDSSSIADFTSLPSTSSKYF